MFIVRRKAKRDLTAEELRRKGPVDLPFLTLVVLLAVIGLIMVFSASYASAYYDVSNVTGNDPTYYLVRQGFFAVLGFGAMWLVSKMDYGLFRVLAKPVLIVSILMLMAVPFVGVTAGGATRWLKIGVQFQPSEIAKIGVIMYFSLRLSRRGKLKKKPYDMRTRKGRVLSLMDEIGLLELVPYGVVLLVIGVLLAAQPHMSATILIFLVGASILFAAGINLGWFLAGGTVAGSALWFVINNTAYMTRRIDLWKNPWLEPQAGGYQSIQSLYAIGSGGLLGLGLGNSRQKFLYIPEPQNDFVFAVVCEELGFIGASIILALFALLVLRGYWLALHARDRFGALMIVGVTTQMAIQVVFNIGVVTNLFPVTGISLPFFSYGGTALVIQMIEMGIILSVSRQNVAH